MFHSPLPLQLSFVQCNYHYCRRALVGVRQWGSCRALRTPCVALCRPAAAAAVSSE